MPLSFPANIIGPNPVVQSGALFFLGGGRIDLNRSISSPFSADPSVAFAGRMPPDISGVSVSCGQFISILPVTGGIGTTAHNGFFIRTDTPNTAEIFALVSGVRVGPANKGAAATVTEYASFYADNPAFSATRTTGINLQISAGAGRFNIYSPGTADNALAGKLYAAQDNLTIQAVCGMFAGTGVPNNANGANGDFYFRGDTPGTVNQRVYQKAAGAWVALAI